STILGTAVANTLDTREIQITATIDGNVKLISEASIRTHLKLEDSDGISTLPDTEIFEQLALMVYASNSDKLTFQKGHFSPQWRFLIHTILHCLSPKKTVWEQFSSNIATAIICMATNRTFNISKMIFEGMGEGSTVPVESHQTPSGGHTPGSDKGSLTLNELTVLCTTLLNKVKSLETDLKLTKQTYGAAFTKLIKKLGVLSDAKILADETRVHTYSRRRRAVSTGRDGVKTVSGIISTAEETISTTENEWENIRLRVEADEELTQKLQAEEREKYSEDDRTKMLVDLINQRTKFFAQQRAEAKRNMPMTQAQQRTYMSNYIKHIGSYTLKQLKKLSFKEIKELFEVTIRRIQDFVPTEKEGGKEVSKLAGAVEQPVEEEKELSQEDLQQLMIIALEQGMNVETLQFFDDMLKVFDKDNLVQLWSLVKERFSSTEPNDDKDLVLLVELKRLFEPNIDDELWKLQRYMHDLLKWRLYDTCGVRHVPKERGHDIFMLVEKDYPLKKGLMTVMLVNKLQVDEFSKMANELLRKNFIAANNP
nr:synaptobrevin, longin-like domain protein [Tanacetum cinerariifolium]